MISLRNIILLFVLCTGCMVRPLQKQQDAYQTAADLTTISRGMSKKTVEARLGSPYKTKYEHMNDQVFEIWFYLTIPLQLGQEKPTEYNFTPIIFQKNYVYAIGKKAYEQIIDYEQFQLEKEEEAREKYTDDPSEWPSEEHKILTPPKYEQTPSTEKVLKGVLEEAREKEMKEKKEKEAQKPPPQKQLPPSTVSPEPQEEKTAQKIEQELPKAQPQKSSNTYNKQGDDSSDVLSKEEEEMIEESKKTSEEEPSEGDEEGHYQCPASSEEQKNWWE